MCQQACVTLSVLIAIFMGCGCGGGGNVQTSSSSDPPPSQPSTIVAVTPSSPSVYEGGTVQFQARVQGQSNQTVTWSLKDNFGTIDNNGLYTAPRDEYGGPETITATSQADPNAKGTAAVTVLPIEVKVSPTTVTLAPGAAQNFTASVVGLSDTTVTWSVQEANGGSITNDGVYIAPPATGFYHVVATTVADPTRAGTSIVTVTTSSAKFSPTGNMQQPRGYQTATLLTNGKVLMAGGATRADPLCAGGITSAELYDSSSGSFTKTGSLSAQRYAHTATLLQNGDALLAGGFGSGYDCEDLGEPSQSSAEIYNPSTGTFQTAGNMTMGRAGHTATLLANCEVLFVGGGDQGGATLPFYGTASATAELYDPSANAFTSTGRMAAARFGHTATLLKSGKVLIAGGTDSYSDSPLSTTEIYDPATGHFVPSGSMTTPRMGHTATLLADGRVLITGGFITGLINGQFGVSSTAELYDPATDSFSTTGQMGVMREEHTATLLPNGLVLVAGGGNPTAEVYDPSTGLFVPTSSMETERTGHSATLLPNGKVLVAGGGSRFPLASAELYQ
jgi:WD40 repeat protein